MRFDRMASAWYARICRQRRREPVVPAAARVHQNAARARRTRHRVHVPRAPTHAHLWFPLIKRAYSTATASARRFCIGKPRGGEALVARSAGPPAHRHEPALGVRRSRQAARRLQSAPARCDPEAARSVSRAGNVARREGETDAEIDAWLKKTVSRPSPGEHLPDGHDERLRSRSSDARARNGATARGDASAMPDLVSAHNQRDVLMIGGKGPRIDPGGPSPASWNRPLRWPTSLSHRNRSPCVGRATWTLPSNANSKSCRAPSISGGNPRHRFARAGRMKGRSAYLPGLARSPRDRLSGTEAVPGDLSG